MSSKIGILPGIQLDESLSPQIQAFVLSGIGTTLNRHLTTRGLASQYSNGTIPREDLISIQEFVRIANGIIGFEDISHNLREIKTGIEQPSGRAVISLYYRENPSEPPNFRDESEIRKNGTNQLRILLRSPLRENRGEIYGREACRGKEPGEIVPRTIDSLKGWELILRHDRLGRLWDRRVPITVMSCNCGIANGLKTGTMQTTLSSITVGNRIYDPNV
jgi:hypothetical protein